MLVFIYFYFLGPFFKMSCVRPSVKLSTLCSTQEDEERYGAVLGKKSFPRNPGRTPSVGSQLDSFLLEKIRGKERSMKQ